MGKINDFGFPFTSVTGDRQYSAGEWRNYFESLLSNGIVAGILSTLKINPQAVANKTVFVDTGSIVINGCMRILDTTQNITITDNTSGNARIDRIVARLNYTDRKIEFAVLTGTPAGSPVAPTLTQNTTVWEISLAQIAVANGFSTIVVGNITDQRTYMKYNVEPYDSDAFYGKFSQMSGGILRTTDGIITFSTEDKDDFLAINIPTSASRITIPSTLNAKYVKFCWSGTITLNEFSASSVSIILYKNGSSFKTIQAFKFPSSGSNLDEITNTVVTTPFLVTTGDYFELYGDVGISVVAGSTFGMEVLGS